MLTNNCFYKFLLINRDELHEFVVILQMTGWFLCLYEKALKTVIEWSTVNIFFYHTAL